MECGYCKCNACMPSGILDITSSAKSPAEQYKKCLASNRRKTCENQKVMEAGGMKKNTGQLWKSQYIISDRAAVLQNSEKKMGYASKANCR